MKSKSKEKGSQFHMRLSDAQDSTLRRDAKERGVNVTAYVKERLFSENRSTIYDKESENTIHEITDFLVNELPLKCSNKKLIEQGKKEAEKLWHILNK